MMAHRIINTLTKGLEFLTGVLLMVLTAVALLGVLDRFILHLGWPWPEEIARYLLVWLTFLTSAIAARKGYHFVIDFFVVRLFKKWGINVHRTVVTTITCGILLLVTIKGVELTLIVVSQTSTASGISMGWVYGVIPVGGAFTLLSFLYTAVEASKKHKGSGESNHTGRST